MKGIKNYFIILFMLFIIFIKFIYIISSLII